MKATSWAGGFAATPLSVVLLVLAGVLLCLLGIVCAPVMPWLIGKEYEKGEVAKRALG